MRMLLRDYQDDALARVDACVERGVRRLLGVAATGLGKAQPVDEPVLTPTGWTAIGELRVGDEVIGANGHPTLVIGVFPQGHRPVAHVTFSDRTVVRCDPEHLWTVQTKHDVHRQRPWRCMTTTEIRRKLNFRWRVPVVSPVEHPPIDLPLDPYLLGLLLGDGGLSVKGRVLLHTEDALAATVEVPAPARLKRLHDCGPNGIAGTYIIGGPTGRGANPVLSAIRTLGLEGTNSRTKFVPPEYLFAAAEDRLALLQGFMDADGYSTNGHVGTTIVGRQLADGITAIVRSLGGTCRENHKRTTWTHRGVAKEGEAIRLTIALNTCPFRWKADRWAPRAKYAPARFIESVEIAGTAEQVCIAVASADQLYVTRGYTVTHNTVMFSALAERTDGRTLILAHRDELISQTAAKVMEVWSSDVTITPATHTAVAGLDRRDLLKDRTVELDRAGLGIVKAAADDVTARVVVASVQTLSRPSRLARLVAAGAFDLVVVDECHHATADSYQTVLDAVGALADDGPLLLGVTATADRGDGKGLDSTFTEVAFNYDLLWGIEAGYLSNIRGKQVGIDGFSTEGLKVTRGDYEAGASGAALEAAGAPNHIADAWIEHAKGRRTLVFTPTVQLAASVADEMVNRGIRAAFVSGDTPMDERREILRRYSHGELDVLANCAVLTEGYDEPRTDCIIVARPTKSRSLYTQMVGRGTRRHPDKRDLLVLDVVGVTEHHSLVTIPSLFGLDPDDRRMAEGATITEAVAAWTEEEERAGRLAARDAEMFKRVRQEGIAWVKVTEAATKMSAYVKPLGSRGPKGNKTFLPTVVLLSRHAEDDRWAVGLRYEETGRSRVLMDDVPLELAQGVGEDVVRKMATSLKVVSTDARWRKRRPTENQLIAARKWRLVVDPSWTAGELSERLDALIVAKKAGRGRLLDLAPLEA